MSEQNQDTNVVLLGVILVVILISIALNVFLYKNNSMVDAQLNNPQQIQQAQASQAQMSTIGAMVNDLRGYAADKPALQEILRKSGVQ